MNPFFWTDFYKIDHISQYPKDTEQVWINWTPRSSRVEGTEGVVFFGLQYFIKEFLTHIWDTHFFHRPLSALLKEYREVIQSTLGVQEPRVDHMIELYQLGYLPIEIYAIPEGFSTPLGCPAMVITNTVPEMFWLPNFLETILSAMLWKCCTSATTAQRFRRLFVKKALEAGETDLSFVNWQGHDFSFRGMSGREDAIMSGMAHLLSFSGTDTIPAIVAAQKFYHAKLSCGGSVPATEHSVMCAGTQENERETFRRLIEDVYPTGVVSIVSDTWDLWKVLTKIIPSLKDTILARDGKLVIRPDSGDPVKIITGDDCAPDARDGSISPALLGTACLLAGALGTSGPWQRRMINKAGMIYGDGISVERSDQILTRLIEQGFSPYNMVFGIGSYTYEYVTRDTYGFAIKATAVRRNGEVIDIFKNPVTDDGGKKSCKGIPLVYRTEESTEAKPRFFCVDGGKPEKLDECAFRKVYKDGALLIDEDFETIRERVRA